MNSGNDLSSLVAVFSDIHRSVADPAEEQVSHAGSQDNSQEQPHIVRHHNQHERIGDRHLNQVEECLNDVRLVEDLLPAKATKTNLNANLKLKVFFFVNKFHAFHCEISPLPLKIKTILLL